MFLRDLLLPPGWYPREKADIETFLRPFSGGGQSSAAAVAPHAGWYYSGHTAALSVSCLDAEAETVAVIGGHLPGGMPILFAGEDGVKTPFGAMKIDGELREEFKKQVSPGINTVRPDRYEDNTVEVLLPMVHYFFPRASLLWLRFPSDLSSFEAGKLLAASASTLGRQLVVLASTDLTHYGRNYGYSPHGRGKSALEWVKNVNDASFINAVLEGDPSVVLERAERDKSACSAGAVLGALGFCSSLGKTNARLLDYRSSASAGADIKGQGDDGDDIPDSFVGYAAIAFS